MQPSMDINTIHLLMYEYRNKLQRLKFLHGFKLEIDIFPHQSIDDEVCLFPI